MNKSMWAYILQIAVVVALYYILAEFLSDTLIIVILVVTMVLFISYNLFFKWSGETILEIACNPKKFLETVDNKYKKHDDYYYLLKAYGNIYNGEMDIAKEAFSNFKDMQLLEEKKIYIIYNKVKMLIALHDGDEDLMVDTISEAELSNLKSELLIGYMKVLLTLYRKDYEGLIENLLDFIPKQIKRFHIVELEYYLAFAYVELGEMENANAVLEFMIKKGHPIVYTKKCIELHNKINNIN